MYKMTDRSGLQSDRYSSNSSKYISHELWERLVSGSVEKAQLYWQSALNKESSGVNLKQYLPDLTAAIDAGLFEIGGIEVKDHINLSVLLGILDPDLYVESGVFRGASLHAAFCSIEASRVYGIDPVDQFLSPMVRERMLNPLEMEQDFSKFSLQDDAGSVRAVYFDDHVNSMLRLQHAHAHEFKYALFDDSCGLEGIGQRRYPALPTVGMLQNRELFRLGDVLEWAVPIRTPLSRIRGVLSTGRNAKYHRLRVLIDDEFIMQMESAASLVKKITPFPDLSELLFSHQPGRINNTQKFLVELN